MGYIRQSWSESALLALPEGEHNFFDRKSGKLWGDRAALYATLSKALSAFANSGGGHLILGQQNDGMLDGVPEREGRTPVREWLEQKLPTLVSYPLEAFRVHTVVPDSPSQIPAGKAVVVVDIGESRLAPHQACFPSDDPRYYYRQGGKSVPAPHHYLEALRNRLTVAVVEPRLVSAKVRTCYRTIRPEPVVVLVLSYRVTNVSRVPCYKWAVNVTPVSPNGAEPDYLVSPDEFERLRGGIPVPEDPTILPTLTKECQGELGFLVRTDRPLPEQVGHWLGLEVRYSAISEHHIGQERATQLSSVADAETILQAVSNALEEKGVPQT